MKRIKGLVLFGIVALFSFAFVGITKVEAVTANNFTVVCDPDSIEYGSSANCYLIAKIADGSLHGVATTVVTEHLTITGATGGTGPDSNIASEKLTNGQTSTVLSNFGQSYQCSTTEDNSACYLFISNSETPSITPTQTTGVAPIDSNYNGFTVVGYYVVSLDETATTNNCGKLCVYSKFSPTSQGYGDPEVFASGGSQVCDEISPIATSTQNPESGSFASYAILVAGALIAIGAIAIAKKNNKIYKV